MPNKTRKRSRTSKNFAAIPIDFNLALSTLGSAALISQDALGGNLLEDFFAISCDILAQIRGLTAGEGDPTMGGFAHGDYSDAEIEENLESNLLGPGDKITQERARRLVRKAGIFTTDVPAAVTLKLQGRGGSGLIRTKLKFVINSGKTLKFYVHNLSGANLTTGAILIGQGTLYGRWLI